MPSWGRPSGRQSGHNIGLILTGTQNNFLLLLDYGRLEKDVKTVISAASTRAEDRGETTALMEPLLIAEGSRHRTGLTDFAVELAARSAGFTRSLPPGVRPALGTLVRVTSCYYSNLIEGHDTHPVDIERALKGDYSAEPEKRSLQLEAEAHIAVQEWIDGGGIEGRAATGASLMEIHPPILRATPRRTAAGRTAGHNRAPSGRPWCATRTTCAGRRAHPGESGRGAAVPGPVRSCLQQSWQSRHDPGFRRRASPLAVDSPVPRRQRACRSPAVPRHAAGRSRYRRCLVHRTGPRAQCRKLQDVTCRLRRASPQRPRWTRRLERRGVGGIHSVLSPSVHRSDEIHGELDGPGPAADPNPDLGRRGSAGRRPAAKIWRRARGGSIPGGTAAWRCCCNPGDPGETGTPGDRCTAGGRNIGVGKFACTSAIGFSGKARLALDAWIVS